MFQRWLVLLLLTLAKTAAIASSCDDFDGWAAVHRRSGFASTAERARRRQVFEHNCQYWARLNAVQGGARWGADEHADRTAAEFSAAVSGGCLLTTNQDHSAPPERTATSTAAASAAAVAGATSIDWRWHDGKAYVTPVKNQGAFGTCWSFGVAENLEGLNVRQGHPLTNISEQEFISCCSDCQGHKAENSFVWLMNHTAGRPALEASYPYNGSAAVSCSAASAPRAPVQLHSWGRVQDDGTGAPVVAGLTAHGPMGMGVDATCFHGYHSGVIRNCTSKGVDHAVLMVAAGTDPDTAVRYFTIKNSWGAKWGEDGYVRIEQGHDWWGKLSMIYTE
jgi:hypothetical protein